MDKNNLPGLTPVWLIALATVLGIFITIAAPAVLGPEGIKASDWLGFSGNVLTSGIAAIAIFYGWRGITRQMRIDVVSREEDRIEASLPGLSDMNRFVYSFSRQLLGAWNGQFAIDILKANGFDAQSQTIFLEEVKNQIPRASDADQKQLAIMLRGIWASAVQLKLSEDILERERGIMQSPHADSARRDTAIQILREEEESARRRRDALEESIYTLAKFDVEIVNRMTRLEKRRAACRVEIDEFFDRI